MPVPTPKLPTSLDTIVPFGCKVSPKDFTVADDAGPKGRAKVIRKAFRGLYPGVHFSARTNPLGAIDLTWTDGPSDERVNAELGHLGKPSQADYHQDYFNY